MKTEVQASPGDGCSCRCAQCTTPQGHLRSWKVRPHSVRCQELGSKLNSLRGPPGENQGTPLPLQALPQLQLLFGLEQILGGHSWMEKFQCPPEAPCIHPSHFSPTCAPESAPTSVCGVHWSPH